MKKGIVFTNKKPVFCRPKKESHADNGIIDHKINEWLQQGIIRVNVSSYSFPVVSVDKKNGFKSLCIDYRQLNKEIVKDRYPLYHLLKRNLIVCRSQKNLALLI